MKIRATTMLRRVINTVEQQLYYVIILCQSIYKHTNIMKFLTVITLCVF